MNDFCLRFNEMPTDGYFKGQEKAMQAKMWLKIKDVMED